MKTCSKCKVEAPFSSFSVAKSTKDGLQFQCKQCDREYRLANRTHIRKRNREYYAKHKKEQALSMKQWRVNNSEKIAKAARESYLKNRQVRIEAARAWRAANPGVAKARGCAYRAANYDRVNAAKKAYYRENTDRSRELNRKWREANRDKAREIGDRRRAKKRAAMVEKVNRAVVTVRDKGICGICFLPVAPQDISLDHIIPLSKGGEHSYSNVQLAHRRCNSAKGNRIVVAA